MRYLFRLLFVVSMLWGCQSEPPGKSVLYYEKEWPSVELKKAVGSISAEEAVFHAKTTLADYLDYAALHNPSLQAAFGKWIESRAKADRSRWLDDPQFAYRYFIEEVETRVGTQQQSFSLSQKLPWWGKLKLRSEMARQEARAKRWVYEKKRLLLFYEVKRAYYEYYYLGKAIAVTRENKDLLRHLEEIARTRYKASKTGHADMIRAQVELEKIKDRLRSLEDIKLPLAANLNASLNRPAHATLPWPENITFEESPIAEEKTLAYLQEKNPELKVIDYQAAQSRIGIDLARKEFWPDITLGVQFIDTSDLAGGHPDDEGKDPVIAMLSLNLPVWRGKYRAGVRQAQARYRAVTHQRRELLNSLITRIKMAAYHFRDAARKVVLYRDTLLLKVLESYKVTESAFRSGKGSFNDLVDTQRIVLEYQLAYERALTNQAIRRAELEMLYGHGSTPLE